MHKLSVQELDTYIKEIINCDAFELLSDEGLHSNTSSPSNNYYIPYMMNDALECYLFLKNGRMTGQYLTDSKEPLTAEILSHSETSAIIFRQGSSNVFTIWFEEAFRVLKCFRYDQIGHFWVKGEEHWRRLVYIIGTMYDKYEYMGDQVCNPKELALLPLMEFAPFRMYSPIHESLDAYYSDTSDGWSCIYKLAAEAGDKSFLKLLKIYQRIPAAFVRNVLFRAMNHPQRQKLYELIFQKIQDASILYPERSYHPSLNEEISSARMNVTKKLHQTGFTGTYPLFFKSGKQVLVMEEHPFTILEAKDFLFRIQFMISEVPVSKTAPSSIPLNGGFFKKRGNRCRIASDIKHI